MSLQTTSIIIEVGVVMKLDRQTAAKVSAYYAGWVDPQEFARFADDKLVYRQRHHVQSNRVVGFFVIAKGDKALPMDQLTDLNYAADLLVLVLLYDAVNKRILGVLRAIENGRRSGEGEHFFEIQVVGDEGKDASTSEIKYACSYFGSTSMLAIVHMQSVVKDRLKASEKHAVTLSEVDDFIPTAKRFKASD